MEKLITALNEIVDPIKFAKNNLKEGHVIDGVCLIALSNDANYLKGIAEKALNECVYPKTNAEIDIIKTCIHSAISKAKLGSVLYDKDVVEFAIKFFESLLKK